MKEYTTRYQYRTNNTTPQTSVNNKYVTVGVILSIAVLANIIIASQPYQTLIALLS